ncbi:MAG: hypothetical protein ACR2ME_10125 [Acidimicrobiia bacterium]
MRIRAVVLVLASVLFACTPSNEATTTTLPVTPTSPTSPVAAPVAVTPTIPFSTANPSQTPEDAARDGVVPLIATAPVELRINGQLAAGDSGWSWVASRLTEDFVTLTDASNCHLAQPLSAPAASRGREYGELLLMEGDRIFRAFPMPGSPLSWLYLANEAAYTGHIGDGAIPHSTIMRIDRVTLDTEVWLFGDSADLASETFPTTWHRTLATTGYEQLVGFAPSFDGLAVESLPDGVRIDLDAIRGLFDPTQVVSHIGLVLVEGVTRCGITCFEITFRPTTSTAKWVYPLEIPLAEAETITVDCGAEPAEIAVQPVKGLDPTWNGRTTGCEAVLAFGRWAWYSHYFHLETDDSLRFTQTPGPWADPSLNYEGCFGDPNARPVCDMGHESQPITYTTIESVTAEGTNLTIKGTEWDIRWGGEYDVRGPIGRLTLNIGCGTAIDGESERGENWTRYMDACLTAELFADGESFPGIYAVYGDGAGIIWGLEHIAAIQLP